MWMNRYGKGDAGRMINAEANSNVGGEREFHNVLNPISESQRERETQFECKGGSGESSLSK